VTDVKIGDIIETMQWVVGDDKEKLALIARIPYDLSDRQLDRLSNIPIRRVLDLVKVGKLLEHLTSTKPIRDCDYTDESPARPKPLAREVRAARAAARARRASRMMLARRQAHPG
jgi:hypothetical protein